MRPIYGKFQLEGVSKSQNYHHEEVCSYQLTRCQSCDITGFILAVDPLAINSCAEEVDQSRLSPVCTSNPTPVAEEVQLTNEGEVRMRKTKGHGARGLDGQSDRIGWQQEDHYRACSSRPSHAGCPVQEACSSGQRLGATL